MHDDWVLILVWFVPSVALYAAFATREQLQLDWPARKVRLRDGTRSAHGPFRALDNVRERDVKAGPPWPVRLTALLGHGISPVSFFSTVFTWSYAWMLVRTEPVGEGQLPWWWVFAAIVVSFVVGRHQWQGSTIALTTDYRAALVHSVRAVLSRVLVDAVPLALLAYVKWQEVGEFALFASVPTVHALAAMIAVVASKAHYEAAAVALEERRLATFGTVPR